MIYEVGCDRDKRSFERRLWLPFMISRIYDSFATLLFISRIFLYESCLITRH